MIRTFMVIPSQGCCSGEVTRSKESPGSGISLAANATCVGDPLAELLLLRAEVLQRERPIPVLLEVGVAVLLQVLDDADERVLHGVQDRELVLRARERLAARLPSGEVLLTTERLVHVAYDRVGGERIAELQEVRVLPPLLEVRIFRDLRAVVVHALLEPAPDRLLQASQHRRLLAEGRVHAGEVVVGRRVLRVHLERPPERGHCLLPAPELPACETDELVRPGWCFSGAGLAAATDSASSNAACHSPRCMRDSTPSSCRSCRSIIPPRPDAGEAGESCLLARATYSAGQ
jgi:hypothetical protein